MKVSVYAGSWATRWLHADTAEIAFDRQISALEAVLKAGIPEDEIGPLELNGNIIQPGREMADGETIRVYARIIGG